MTPPLVPPGDPVPNTAPTCNDATLDAQPDTPLSIDVANDLLSHCSDADNDNISLVSTTQPVVTNSMLADDGAGILTYTPAPGYTGADSFDFTVTDIITGSVTATANITVQESLGNFTMLDSSGSSMGGTNDVAFSWDQTANTAETDTNFNMTIASEGPTTFFGIVWTTHHVRVFGPGTYSFDSGCTIAEIEATGCPAGSAAATGSAVTMTIGAGQLGMHALFDWGASTNIDVVNLWDIDGVWNDPDGAASPINDLWLGAAGISPDPEASWNLVSRDANADGINGSPMVDGPFLGYYANFNKGPGIAVFIDTDSDGITDSNDNCPVDPNPDQIDSDTDTVGDICDLFPLDPSEAYDSDGDGVGDNADAFPTNVAASIDVDEDGLPDAWNAGCDIACQSASGLTLDTDVTPNQFGNFTMLDGAGSVMGGTNDVVFNWDQTTNIAVTDTNFNMTIATDGPTTFFGTVWTAHHVRVFGPGTYSFDSGCTIAEIEATGCPAGSAALSGPAITITVGAGQLGMHALFDWGASTNIDVVNLWDIDGVWNDPDGAASVTNNLWLGAAGTPPDPMAVWELVSRDVNGDGNNGNPMVDGPFLGYYANFNKGPGDAAVVIDTVPDAFNFSDQTDKPLSTLVYSDSVIITGLDAATPVFITNGEYSIDGGAYISTEGSIDNGGSITVRTTSSASWSTPVDAVLTIGGVSDTFTVTTEAEPDTTPNQFSYYDRTDAQLNYLYNSTNSIQVSGIVADAPISITGGEYSIDGGAWTSAPGTVSNLSRVLLRQTSAATGSTQTDAVLTIGDVSATFSVTTKAFIADTTPNPFSYYDRTGAQLNYLYNSTNSIQV
ncbi:MAG: cadherin-like domain-containing protein, partial [Gammaproteobacteria bacterium]|nr:cadherin-like domain-containing protein [Gammaproteobacteria bacterium]